MLLRVFIVYALVLAVALRVKGLKASVPPGAPGIVMTDPARQTRSHDGGSLRLVIIGATGGTGRELVTQALERGHQVTALVRNPAALQMIHTRLHVIQGDVLDAASVNAAVAGHDAVISALGHKRFYPPNRILSEGTRNIVRAMEASGVSRFVCETALGVGDSSGRMGLYYTLFVVPLILPAYFWDKTRQERVIAESRLNWIIVRPGMLTNASRRGRYRYGLKVGSFVRTVRISRADVADFMLNQVIDNTYLRSAPGVSW